MIAIPTLVQDFNLRILTNSVLVGTAKFTFDQWTLFFTPQNPALPRLDAQFQSYGACYNVLNASYALTRESLLTQDVTNLDKEGDQLFIGLKETVAGAQRMTYVPTRKQAGDRLNVFIKKYKIDTKENFISEWSKLQQLCEEANASQSLTADLATLGLTDMMARLTDIANQLRDKLTERSNELPELKAMKQAREAFYPEYRALIQLLNAAALLDSDTTKYASLIQTLNRNIDYVRIHAVTGGSSSSSSGGNGGNSGGGGTDPTPSGGGDEPIPDDPDPTPSGGGGDEPIPDDPDPTPSGGGGSGDEPIPDGD